MRTLLALALVLSACGPSQGDIYEDAETGARYRVANVGPCDFIREHAVPERTVVGSYDGDGTCIHLQQLEGFGPRGEIDRLLGDTHFVASRDQLGQRFRRL